MNREIVRDLALAAGFKLKPQADNTEDLNEYVYRFAGMVGANAALSGYAQLVKASCLRLQAGDVVAITLKQEFFERSDFHEFYMKGLTSLLPAGVHCTVIAEGCSLSVSDEKSDDQKRIKELELQLATAEADAKMQRDMKDRARKERDSVAVKLNLLSKAAADQLAELSQHQTCTHCGCGAEEPESVALRAAIDVRSVDCLAQVRADAGRAGWVACARVYCTDEHFTPHPLTGMTAIKGAVQYAERIRQGGDGKA